MRIQLMLGALLLLSLTCAGPANASQLYSVAGLGLHLIDQNTGQLSSVMNVPGGVSDLAGTGPFVWAVSTGTSQLMKIRPSTQEILSTVLLSSPVGALAIHPLDSTFVGVRGSNLVNINSRTGAVSVIASLAPSIAVESLTFDNVGNLYGVGSNSFFSISTADATVNVINNSVPTNGLSGLAVRPEDGTMFLAAIGTSAYQLFTINVDTGARTLVGDSLPRSNGLAFTTVPEPATWGSLMLASILGLWRLRSARYHHP